MAQHFNQNWFYGLSSREITGTKYGALARITTPSSLPTPAGLVAYFVSCKSTTTYYDDEGILQHRFYQATIAYTNTAGSWHFSWGYAPNNLSQPPYTGLTPTTNHNYELGIQFTGTVGQAYVIDLATNTIYTMGSVADTGTMWVDDNPGFLMESDLDSVSDINVAAFKAYNFNVFTSPSSSTSWPAAKSYYQPYHNPDDPSQDYDIPALIHTYTVGTKQYKIGYTTSGSHIDNSTTTLW